MYPGGVKHRDGRVLRPDEQIDLGAPEQDRFGTEVGQIAHDPPVLLARPLTQHADAQLVIDDVMDDPTIRLLGHDHV
jgi:hypothetical protein